MRRLLAARFAALGLIGLLSPAFAADYDLPVLRGSNMFVPAYPTYSNWQGAYGGVQVGYQSATADFGRATQPLIAFSLQQLALLSQMNPDQWQVLGSSSVGAAGFGGFVGYNMQWDNVVVGVELNYTHSSFEFEPLSTPLGRRQTVNGLIDDVSIDASARMHISDFATTRARFGWTIGHFMPYGAIGIAFGRADVAVSTVANVTELDPNNPNPPPALLPVPRVVGQLTASNSLSKEGAFMYGVSGAAGLEYALTQNIFARAEYESIQWARFFSISTSMHNFRAGLGVKF